MKKNVLVSLVALLAMAWLFAVPGSLALETKTGVKKTRFPAPEKAKAEAPAATSALTAAEGAYKSVSVLLRDYNAEAQKIMECGMRVSKFNSRESEKIWEMRDILENIYDQTAVFLRLLEAAAWIRPDKTPAYKAFLVKYYRIYEKAYKDYGSLTNHVVAEIQDRQALESIDKARDILDQCHQALSGLYEKKQPL